VREFRTIYPDPGDFVDSTATARVNGYLAGYGSLEMLRDELDSLGLSAKGRDRLWERVSRLHPDEKVEQCPID
jgi:peptide-methionine (S)-S-oxide reductase